MSAPTTCHHRPPTAHDRANAVGGQSRIPTKAGNLGHSLSKSTQHIPKLMKRPSHRVASSDNVAYRREGTSTGPVPGLATGAGQDSVVSQGRSLSGKSVVGQHRKMSSSSRIAQPPSMRMPSLASVSSNQTTDTSGPRKLRRKPSTIDSYTARMRECGLGAGDEHALAYKQSADPYMAHDDAVLGISLPSTGKHEYSDLYSQRAVPSRYLPSLDTQNMPPCRDFTPPVPGLSHSATPSTRYTDSPFSHVPTPSSASSYSSGLYSTVANGAKHAPASPRRPRPASREMKLDENSRKALPPVRESSTPSLSVPKTRRNETGVASQKPAPALPSGTAKPTGSRVPTPSRKQVTPAQSSQAAVQIPPELAHLNVDPPPNPRASFTQPPKRPSRSRTPSLTNVNGPSPVVHSDLPPLNTTNHMRTPSLDTNGSATSTSLRSRFGFSPRSSSKQGARRVDSAFSPSPASKGSAQPPTPDQSRPDRPRVLRKDSPAVGQPPSPAPSKSSRFSFLSRKSKSGLEKTTEKPKREPKKGPAAGTGHEKYAKFGFRGRSNSATNSQTFSRSSSADSNKSFGSRFGFSRKGSMTSEDVSEMDDFLKARLSPVVLRGRGNSFGNQTTVWSENEGASSSSVSVGSSLQPQLLPSAMNMTEPLPALEGQTSNQTSQPLDSENDIVVRHAAPADSGSPDEPEVANGEPMQDPPSLETSVPSNGSSLKSYGDESSTYPRTASTSPPQEAQEGKEGLWLRPMKREQSAPTLKHKKNFFQRAQLAHSAGRETMTDEAQQEDHAKPYQDAVHLGILDAVEPVELADVERIIREHDTSTLSCSTTGKRLSRGGSFDSRRSSLWPSPGNAPFRQSDSSDARRLSPSVMAGQIMTESPELLQARAAVSRQPGRIVQMKIGPSSLFQSIGNSEQVSPQEEQNITIPEIEHENNEPGSPSQIDIAREPRLSPIGRIPSVVSRRDRDRRLPDNSFSRPFVSTQPRPTVRPPGSLYNQIRHLASPVESGSQPASSSSDRSDGASAVYQSSVNIDQPSASTTRSSIDFYAGSDFITFAPRKNAELTYSSSSSNYSTATAAVPSHANQEDLDIWNEYNDLMDDVMPQRTPVSAGSSMGAPFQYVNILRKHSPAMPAPLNLERPASQQQRTSLSPPQAPDGAMNLALFQQGDQHLQPPVSPMAPEEHEAVAIAEEQDDDRFTTRPVSPLTPDTLARFVGAYGDRSTTSSFVPNRLSIPQSHASNLPGYRGSLASRHSRNSRHSRSASLPEANARDSQISLAQSARFSRDAQLLDIPEHDAGKKSTSSNLRFGALMTSKWLSFGRILFSPAHNEVRLADDPRVLVVDGLGDDWSRYVATSYPNAAVYNLSISASNDTESSGWGSLSNYYHYNHASLSAPFPFPKGFFTAVVFRFPVAASEHSYQACISESKRVLRPGGHLEVVALDIDMMNMGTRGRRALRGLKTRMQQCDQDVSLRNLSDILVRMIGRRGFEEVQRCIVGVPAAGRIPRSDDVRSSRSSSTSTGSRPYRSDSNSTDSQDKDISFATLLQNNRESQLVGPGRANDEGITKMVARVGRWWYSACYEQSLLDTDESVWQEPGLLRECEKQGTSFRLLICCAQKPLQTRRRTKSV